MKLTEVGKPILEITSREWLINIKSLPDEESSEYDDFWMHHKRLAEQGCTVDGVRIPGFLYWHLNMWKLAVSYVDEYGIPRDKIESPLLRDNEWLISNAIADAEIMRPGLGRKGVVIGGSRRISKSSIISSYLAMGATFDQNSQNVFVGLNSDDISVTTDMISKGMYAIPEPYRWDRLSRNWNKEVAFGVRHQNGDTDVFSKIIIRNLNNGINEEAIAGTKPRKLVIEEAGKGEFLKGLLAARPGFTTPMGWGCSPIVIFTGGDMERFHDAKQLMMNPEAYNFLEFQDEKIPDRKHGLFLGLKYRQEAKKESTLGDYLQAPNKKSPLFRIPMLVSDEVKAKEITDKAVELLRVSGDRTAYLKEKMYFPETVDDIFQNTSNSMYNKSAIARQIGRIEAQGLGGTAVELFHDGSKITWKHSGKKPITDLDHKGDLDAPIVIYEFPVPNPPKFLYCIGIDSYRHDKSVSKESLGSVYVYKRMHSLTGEDFQEMFVASYNARPDNREEWNETVKNLIKFYNGYALVENDELGFIEYMKHEGEAEVYLAPQPKFQKSLVVNSSLTRDYGVSRTAAKVRDYMDGLWGKYLDEKIHVEKDEEGNVIKEVLGVSRVFDLRLLRESSIYDGIVNSDAVVAAQCALALANELDPLLGSKSDNNKVDPRFQSLFGKTEHKTQRRTTFSTRGKKSFTKLRK